jgi:hypothetical protein
MVKVMMRSLTQMNSLTSFMSTLASLRGRKSRSRS